MQIKIDSYNIADWAEGPIGKMDSKIVEEASLEIFGPLVAGLPVDKAVIFGNNPSNFDYPQYQLIFNISCMIETTMKASRDIKKTLKMIEEITKTIIKAHASGVKTKDIRSKSGEKPVVLEFNYNPDLFFELEGKAQKILQAFLLIVETIESNAIPSPISIFEVFGHLVNEFATTNEDLHDYALLTAWITLAIEKKLLPVKAIIQDMS